MNGDTRVVCWKGAEPDAEPEPDVPSLEGLLAHEREPRLEDPDITRLRSQTHDDMLRWLNHTDSDNGDATEKTLTAAQLKAKAMAVAHEAAPIQIATFDA
jgi:hypothetical protein